MDAKLGCRLGDGPASFDRLSSQPVAKRTAERTTAADHDVDRIALPNSWPTRAASTMPCGESLRETGIRAARRRVAHELRKVLRPANDDLQAGPHLIHSADLDVDEPERK